jgi:hypothetical protein
MLCTLYFVDDQVVIVQDKDDLGCMDRKLQEAREQRGLKTNKRKCEYVTSTCRR